MNSEKGKKNILTRIFHRETSSFLKWCFVVFVIAFSSPVLAAVNSQINYQGKLTNSSNVAVSDGNYIMKFRLYTAASSATTTNVWEEIRTATGDLAAVTNGLFSVMLGSTTPLTSVNFNQTLYLGVEVCGTSSLAGCDGEMTPRKVLGAVPGAILATAVSGSTTPSSFGTTTSLTNTQVTIEATTTTAIPLTLRGASGQTANLFNVQNSAVSPLFFINATGGVFASSTLQVTATTTMYSDAVVNGSLIVNNATSTITNLSMFTSTSTSATSTNFAVFTNARFGGSATSTFNSSGDLFVVGSTTVSNITMNNATSTNATTTTLYVSGRAIFNNRLGIGTTTPYAPLSVVGETVSTYFTATSTTASSTFAGALGVGTTSPFAKFSVEMDAYNPSFVVSNSGSSTPTLWIGGINQDGRIGIGTSTLTVSSITLTDKVTLYDGSFRQAPGNPVQVSSLALGTVPAAIAISGRYAYVIDSGSDDLKIIDVSNPASPAQVGSLALGASPAAIAISGRYAYVTDFGGSNDLKIIDVSNPASPAQVGSLAPGNAVNTIAISGRYVYLIVDAVNSLRIIDVSNPASPVQVGSLAAGSQAIAISGRYVYEADAVADSFKIIDVSNPASPVQVGSVALGTNPLDLAISGRYAFVTDSGSDDLKIIDVSNPASPAQVGSVALGTFPEAVAISGRYVYVVDSGSDDLKIIDVSNPASPVTVGTLALGTNPASVAISGRYAYVIDSGSDDLKVIDLTGLEAASGMIHSLEAGSLQVRESATVQNLLSVGTSINVGAGGIYSSGPISVSMASTTASTTPSAYFQSNVGIGSTSPMALFTIQGNPELYRQQLFAVASSTGAATTTLVVIDSNGRFGIGTTSPYAALSVVGQVVGEYFTATSTTKQSFIDYRLGIGTTTAQWQLQIASSTGPQLTLSDTLATADHWSFRNKGGTLYVATSSPTTFATSSVSALAINSSGDLTLHGITLAVPLSIASGGTNASSFAVANTLAYYDGTSLVATSTNPLYVNALVATSTTATSTFANAAGIATTTPWGTLSVEMGAVNPSFVVSNTGSSTPSLFIGGVNQNGYIGIGTAAPTAALTVDGGDIKFLATTGTRTIGINSSASGSAGGALTISAGTTGSGAGGALTLSAGAGAGTGAGKSGGNISVLAGDASGTTGAAGVVTITAGTGGTGSAGGAVTINAGADGGAGTGDIILGNLAGTVHIGATGAGGEKLDVEGAIQLDLNTSASDEAVCKTGAEDATADVSLTDCTTGVTADYAEMYAVETGTEFGHIVAIGDEYITTKPHRLAPATYSFVKLVKATSATKDRIIGIVSNNYSDFSLTGKNIRDEDNPMPVSLAGRVPTFVSDENGPIRVGDRITASSVPGVGMRANHGDDTVGIALEPLTADSTKTQIMVFVNLVSRRLDPAIQNGNINLAGGWTVDAGTGRIRALGTVDLDGHGIENIKAIRSAADNWSIDENGLFQVKEIRAEKLCLGETCLDEQTLKNLLNRNGIEPEPIPEPEPQPEPEVEPPPEQEPDPQPEEEPIPEPEPDPQPEVEPTPEVEVEPPVVDSQPPVEDTQTQTTASPDDSS